MNEKQKAKELIEKFIDLLPYSNRVYETAKQCALICVDEILDIDCHNMSEEHFNNHIEYWQNVKTEIENYEP